MRTLKDYFRHRAEENFARTKRITLWTTVAWCFVVPVSFVLAWDSRDLQEHGEQVEEQQSAEASLCRSVATLAIYLSLIGSTLVLRYTAFGKRHVEGIAASYATVFLCAIALANNTFDVKVGKSFERCVALNMSVSIGGATRGETCTIASVRRFGSTAANVSAAQSPAVVALQLMPPFASTLTRASPA